MAKVAEGSRENYDTYCQAMNKYGTRVLAKLLRWYYIGGNVNYYTFLESLNVLDNCDLFDATYKHNLKYKEPEEYDFKLLHMLLQFASNMYYNKKFRDKEDLYECVHSCIHIIVSQGTMYNNDKGTLTDSELGQQIYNILLVYVQTIKIGAEILELPEEEYFPFIKETHLGVMSLGVLDEKGTGLEVTVHASGNKSKSKVAAAFSDLCIKNLREEMESEFLEPGADDGTVIETAFNAVLNRKEQNHIFSSLAPIELLEKKMVSSILPAIFSSKNLAQHTRRNSSKKSVILEGKIVNKRCTETKSVNVPDSSASKKTNRKSVAESKADNDNVNVKRTSKKSDQVVSKASSKPYKIENSDLCDSGAALDSNSDKSQVAECKHILKSICFSSSQLELSSHKDAGDSSIYSCAHIVLKQHQKYSQKPGQVVEIKNLLHIRGMDDNSAQIILLSGEAGMGKSWIMGFIPEMYSAEKVEDNNQDALQFLFCCNLEKNGCKSFLELVVDTCKNSVKNFKVKEELILKEVLKHPTTVSFDGYCESNESSLLLLKDVLEKTETNLRVIIACRPYYVDCIYKEIPKSRRKHVCHVSLEAVPPSLHANFVTRIMDRSITGKDENIKLRQIKEGLISQLPFVYDVIGEDLCSPLMLKIITRMWIEHSNI